MDDSAKKFEIKVALLRNVSVVKSTVLNAILGDKFREMAKKRTTAGINLFRIINPGSSTTDNVENEDAGVEKVPTQKAVYVLEEIGANVELRGTRRIEERWFSIELEEQLLCEMRNDSSLVLVDIPGTNEADTDGIYTKYVEENWKNFDCVVAIMDGTEDIETEEQIALLKLIKTNTASKKRTPTIILFNKVYEPDNDGEQAALLNESRKKVSQLFGVSCRENRRRISLNLPPNHLAPLTRSVSPRPLCVHSSIGQRLR